MVFRWISSNSFVLGIEVRPVTRRVIWALHLGPWSALLVTPWWL